MGDMQFSALDSRKYLAISKNNDRLPQLGTLARLLMNVPATAIPQERHFSELKCRSAGIGNKTKAETLDRNAIIHAWVNKQDYSVVSWFQGRAESS